MNIREIIKEAVTRVNLVPRRQAVPGDLVETAFRLLKGIVAKYNNDNLLNFTQNCIVTKNSLLTHVFEESDYAKGENNLFFRTEYDMSMYHLSEQDYENNVYAMIYGRTGSYYSVQKNGDQYTWLVHIMDQYPSQRLQEMINYAMIVFTAVPKSEGEFIIAIKPILASYQSWKMTINYNEGIDFDLDSDLFIPENYTELLIVALAHKLALQFPRLDDAQMQRLERDLQVMVDNVRTPKAMTKFLARETDVWNSQRLTQQELEGGTWLP